MGVLLMLMTIAGLVVAVILLIVSVITEKTWLTKFVLGGVAVWFVFYTVMLLGFSLTSEERDVAIGDTDGKAFCGFYLDCHMHAMVTSVRTAKAIGDRRADGQFYIVNVKVFSDAKNPAIDLHLIEPKARIVLASGDKIERDTAAEELLPTASIQLDRDITNRETIEKEIVFDVPTYVADLRLLITEGYGIDKTIERVLVGDEDSFLHAQTFFELKEQNQTAGVK
jgi:hypothetical protein